MERSVTESPRAPKRQRIVRWVEGVLVGIAIFTKARSFRKSPAGLGDSVRWLDCGFDGAHDSRS